MTLDENYLIYPDGQNQEIERPLQVNQVVDMNGRPLRISFPAPRIIAYRIFRISHQEERGIRRRLHFGELLNMDELNAYARSQL